MKKFISFALIAAMAVTTLVGCGNKGAKADGGSSDAAITVMSREDGSNKRSFHRTVWYRRRRKRRKSR